MIEFVNVSKSYDKKIIDNLNFSLEGFEKMGIFGVSGIGKSTLVDLILGLEKADKGKISNDYKRPAVVFQENRLIEEISAFDNLRMVSDDKELIVEALEKFGIDDCKQKISELSGGMKRRVSLARAYIYGGDLLILDEPFTGIDDDNKVLIAALLKARFDKSALILISHNMADYELFDIIPSKLLRL